MLHGNEQRALFLRKKGRRRDRDVFQRQLPALEVEIGLGGRKHYRHLRAAEIVGNEAEYYRAEAISVEEALGAQIDLVDPVPVNPTIDHPLSRELIELRRPSLRIRHLVPESVGVTYRQDRIFGPIPNLAAAVGADSI